MIPETYLLKPFKGYKLPPLPCPTCGASLVMRENRIAADECRASREEYEKYDCSDLRHGIFALRLVCSHRACGESVMCLGTYSMLEDEYPDGQRIMARMLTPLFFTPTIHIFSLPESFPDELKKTFLESFSLFWSNPSASGNSLRVALEALMNNRGVRKSERDKSGKRRPLSLHERIGEFSKTNPDIGDKLLALKWLGNWGSHLRGLKAYDLVAGFRLLEYVVEELFEKRVRKLAAAARRINRRKGPASNS